MTSYIIQWHKQKYRIEYTPSILLSIATKIAEVENLSHIYVHKRLVSSIMAEYKTVRKTIDTILAEK